MFFILSTRHLLTWCDLSLRRFQVLSRSGGGAGVCMLVVVCREVIVEKMRCVGGDGGEVVLGS